jgi:hypothetical protein
MKTKVWFKNLENGQVLPIVVVSLFALIAMAALMIDGGMLLSHRRTAQAAADAGALAGARSLCPNDKTVSERKIEARAKAIEFVEDRNNADFILLPDNLQFPDDNTIRVETSVSSQAFFARIFDQFDLTAAAAAEANCTPPFTAQILPLGIPCYPRDYFVVEDDEEGDGELPLYVDYVSDSENCYLKFGDLEKTDQQNLEDGNMVLILTSDKKDDWCYPSGPINCNDPKRQSVLAGESHNGWLSLEGSSGGNAIVDYINNLNGWASRGEWIYGEGGKMDTFYTPEKNSPLGSLVGKVVTVPLFNEFCRGNPSIHCSPPNMDPGKMRPGDTVTCRNNNCASAGVGDLFYRIDAFTAFKITCVRKGKQQTCPYQQHLIEEGTFKVDKNDNFWTHNNSFEGYFVKAEIPYGGGGGIDTGLFVVQLTK